MDKLHLYHLRRRIYWWVKGVPLGIQLQFNSNDWKGKLLRLLCVIEYCASFLPLQIWSSISESLAASRMFSDREWHEQRAQAEGTGVVMLVKSEGLEVSVPVRGLSSSGPQWEEQSAYRPGGRRIQVRYLGYLTISFPSKGCVLLLVEKCIFENKPTLILYTNSGVSKRSSLDQGFPSIHPRQESSYADVKESGSHRLSFEFLVPSW